MPSRIPRTERLLNLTAVLLDSNRPLTRDELRSKVEGYPDDDNSFRRQFERDKDTLREIGIPLAVLPVPYTDGEQGYRIPPEDYYLQGAEFTPAELAALHVATMAVQFGNSDEEALWKLGGLGITDAAEVDTLAGGPISELPVDAALLEAFGAIQDRAVVSFEYRGGTARRRREVEPWSLFFQRGRWYLTGFDRTADGERQFRLDRMSDLERTDGGFRHPIRPRQPNAPLRPWEIGTNDPVTVELFVVDSVAPAVAKRVGAEPARTQSIDGISGVVFELSVRAIDACVSFALEWLEDAAVLSPPAVRNAVVETLRASAGRDSR